jgi:hypothetical protein
VGTGPGDTRELAHQFLAENEPKLRIGHNNNKFKLTQSAREGMSRITWLYRFCAAGVAIAGSSFLCSVIGNKLSYPMSRWFVMFYIAAGVAVVAVCVVDEQVLTWATHRGRGMGLGAGALRGVIISLCVGLGILFWISVLIETGDKFAGFACVLIGLATLFGPLAGAIVRASRIR